MAEIKLVTGETLSVPEATAEALLQRLTSGTGGFAIIPIGGLTYWLNAAQVMYVRDNQEMPPS